MLDYIEGSAGLPGDSPIRELLFDTSCWGGGSVGYIWPITQRKLQPPLSV